MPKFIVPSSLPPLTTKDYLRKYAGISLTLWRKIKAADEFYINEHKVNPAVSIVKPNDVISYEIKTQTSIIPVTMPLTIAYEDNYILVIDKPAGMLVHPTTKEHTQTLANAVLAYYQTSNTPYDFHPVHRLDRDTSGLVLIAKMPQIQHQLSLSAKNFHRIYSALITGTLTPSKGIIDLPIKRHPDSIISRMVSPDGQKAVTHYETQKTNGLISLLELALETGRTHQIRVHLSALGHPLLGDDLYGGCRDIIKRQALHARKLSFLHPITNKMIHTHSRLPSDIQNILNYF